MNKWILIASAVVSFCLIRQTAIAATQNPTQPANISKNIENLAEDYRKTKESLVEEEQKQRKVMSVLFSINKKMKKIISRKSQFEQERMELESQTRELAKRILDLEGQLNQQKTLMRERLSAIYKFGGQGFARMILSSTSSAQLERNLKILGIISKRDLEIIKNYSAIMKELESKKQRLSIRLVKLKKLEKNIRDQEVLLTAENKSKTRILDQIRLTKEFKISKLGHLRKQSSRYIENDDSGVLDLLFMPSFFEQKGKLPAPINGQVIQSFGLVKDPETNVMWSHKGLFFSAPRGSKIRSIFSGTVSFIGDVPGFGQTIIIDHGDHYYTVYTYHQNHSVQEGMEVKQGQVIAESAETKNGSGLYFEIRHFSEPYDPRKWLKGINL